MKKIDVDPSLLQKVRDSLFESSVVFFKTEKVEHSKSAGNQDRIGELLNKRNKSIPITVLRNWQDRIRSADSSNKNVPVKIDLLIAIQDFFEDVIKSQYLIESNDLELRQTLSNLVSELIYLKGQKNSTLILTHKSDPIPQYLIGVYKAFFLRPWKEKPKNHIAMLVVYIDESSLVRVKSTKVEQYNIGTVIYQTTSPKILVCKFEGTKKEKTHIFQFSLSHNPDEDAFTINPILTGVYGGTDPKSNIPICGKILLERVEKIKKKNWNALYEETDPVDFETETSVADFFSNHSHIFNFLKSNDYVEDTSFFKHFSLTQDTDLGLMGLTDVYTIYSLQSDEFKIGIGAMKIGRLGNVEIIGSDNKIYYGFAKVFDAEILSINITEMVNRGRPRSDYYFNYLVNVWKDNKGQKFFHGVRTIIAPSDKRNHKPSAARIIIERREGFSSDVNKRIGEKPLEIKKNLNKDQLRMICENEVFSEIKYKKIDILPYQWNRENPKEKKLVFDSKIKPVIQFNDDLKNRIITYLRGDATNLIIASANPSPSFTKIENYAEIYFYAALCYAKKSFLKKAKFNFERAFLHGFQGADYLKLLTKERTRIKELKKIKKGDELIMAIKETEINGVTFFYFESLQ